MDHVDNRITLQKLDVFCKVATLGGVGKAAEALFLTQPVVSAHLKDLQERLGVELLVKDGRTIRLTEAGNRTYQWASEVLRGRHNLIRELDDLGEGIAGTATIGAGMSVGNYLLPKLLVEFRSTHPGARITLQNSNVESALDGVSSGKLDYCFVATYEALDASTFDAKLVGRPKYTLIASTDDESLPDSITIAELATLDFISPPGGMRIRASQDFALSTIGVADRRIVMELGSAESIKYAVSRALGVSLLWQTSVSEEIKNGTLREIEVQGQTIHDNLYRVQRRGGHLTPLQTRLRDYLSDGISRRLK